MFVKGDPTKAERKTDILHLTGKIFFRYKYRNTAIPDTLFLNANS